MSGPKYRRANKHPKMTVLKIRFCVCVLFTFAAAQWIDKKKGPVSIGRSEDRYFDLHLDLSRYTQEENYSTTRLTTMHNREIWNWKAWNQYGKYKVNISVEICQYCWAHHWPVDPGRTCWKKAWKREGYRCLSFSSTVKFPEPRSAAASWHSKIKVPHWISHICGMYARNMFGRKAKFC